MAARFPAPDTAFSTDGSRRTKRPRVQERAHLIFIRSLCCLACGKHNGPCEAAHIRFADHRYGKRAAGMAEKPDDKYTVPLCSWCHRDQHGNDERMWWSVRFIEPVPIAQALYIHSGNTEICELILQHAKS